jgi:hypothetical protein
MLESPLILTTENFQGRFFGHGVLKGYEGFIERYLCRNLSDDDDDDILNTFGGILEALFVHMGPFRWGIPVIMVTQATTWHSKDEFPLKRRQGFPTWSWTAWKNLKELGKLKRSAITHEESVSSDIRNTKFVFTGKRRMHEIDRLGGLIPERFDIDSRMDKASTRFEDRQAWNLLKDTYDQYIIFWAECAFLTVDQESEFEMDGQSGGKKHIFHARNEYDKVCSLYLDPNWRKHKPDKLKLVAFACTADWVELMLVERSGAITYRVQVSHEWIFPSRWRLSSP